MEPRNRVQALLSRLRTLLRGGVGEERREPMKAYKGFNKDMTCRGFRYEVGKEYETDRARLCENGFHACENPLNVLCYYPLRDGNRYCEVEQDGEVEQDSNKTASTKIKIGAEIGFHGGTSLWCSREVYHNAQPMASFTGLCHPFRLRRPSASLKWMSYRRARRRQRYPGGCEDLLSWPLPRALLCQGSLPRSASGGSSSP